MALSNVQRAAVAIVSATTLIAGGTAAYNMYMSKYVAQPLTLLEKHEIPTAVDNFNIPSGLSGKDIAAMAAKVWIHYAESGIIYSQNSCTKIYVDRAYKYNKMVEEFNKNPDLKKKYSSQDPLNKFPFNRTADCNSYVKDVLDKCGIRPPMGWAETGNLVQDKDPSRNSNSETEILNSYSASYFKNEDNIAKDPNWKLIFSNKTTEELKAGEGLSPGDIAACEGHVQIYQGDGLWWSWESNYLNDAKNPDGLTERRTYTEFEKEVLHARSNDNDRYIYDDTFPNSIEYKMPCPLRDHGPDTKWTVMRYDGKSYGDPENPAPYIAKIAGHWGKDTEPNPENKDRIYLGTTKKLVLNKRPIKDKPIIEYTYDDIYNAYRTKWKDTEDVCPKLSNYMAWEFSPGSEHPWNGASCRSYDQSKLNPVGKDKSQWYQDSKTAINATTVEYVLITRSEPHELRYYQTDIVDTKAHTFLSNTNNKLNWIIQTGFALGKNSSKPGIFYTKAGGNSDNYSTQYSSEVGSNQFYNDAQQWLSNGLMELRAINQADKDCEGNYYIVGIRYFK